MLFLSLVLVVVLVVKLVSCWSDLLFSVTSAAEGFSSRFTWDFVVNVCWSDLLLFMKFLPFLVMGHGYGLFLVKECCGFPSGNRSGLYSLLLLVINSWGFEDICNFTAMFWIIKDYINMLWCGDFSAYIRFCRWLFQRDYGGFTWYWSATLAYGFPAYYNCFWVYYYASIFVRLKKEVLFLLFFSSYHSMFGYFILYFYYDLFMCWKVLFFTGARIEVVFPGSIIFDEGLRFCSFFLSLLFWARSPCRPRMFLGNLVFLVSWGTSAHRFYFFFWIVSLRRISELKVPLRTL